MPTVSGELGLTVPAVADSSDKPAVTEPERTSEKDGPAYFILAKGSYDKLVRLLLKNGQRTKENMVQLSYWDPTGNRHGIVLIQRPTDGDFKDARPVEINAWVNRSETDEVPGKDVFGYTVNSGDSVMMEAPEDKAHERDIAVALISLTMEN